MILQKIHSRKFQKVIANLVALSLILVIIGFTTQTFAEDVTTNSSSVSTSASGFSNPIKANDLSTLLTDLLKVVTTIGAVVVVFFLILAGFKYVTARGDSKKISEAHNTLTWTVIGAMVLLGAQVIATAIQGTINELK